VSKYIDTSFQGEENEKKIMVVLAVGMVAGGVTSCAKSDNASSAARSSSVPKTCQGTDCHCGCQAA